MFICILIMYGCKSNKTNMGENEISWASKWDGDLDEYLIEYKTFSYSDGRPFAITKNDFHSLSEEEQQLATKILQEYFLDTNFSTHKQKPYPLREYFRQYVGYQKGEHIMVHVNLYTHISYRKDPQCMCIYMKDLTRTIINEKNGGSHYGTVIIDLTEKKVKSFSLS